MRQLMLNATINPTYHSLLTENDSLKFLARKFFSEQIGINKGNKTIDVPVLENWKTELLSDLYYIIISESKGMDFMGALMDVYFDGQSLTESTVSKTLVMLKFD